MLVKRSWGQMPVVKGLHTFGSHSEMSVTVMPIDSAPMSCSRCLRWISAIRPILAEDEECETISTLQLRRRTEGRRHGE